VEFETILYEVETGVATITLNRPDKLNAFTPKMHEELREGFKQIKRDQAVRAVLITGAGRGFCAGADLNERDLSPEAGPPDLGATLERNYNRLVRLIRASEKPVVAAVNGIAAGAGCNTALACDIVIAARSAAFLQAFVHIGVIPDAGGTYSLPRLVGQARATAMAMLGDKIPNATCRPSPGGARITARAWPPFARSAKPPLRAADGGPLPRYPRRRDRGGHHGGRHRAGRRDGRASGAAL
jgi:2-(1,2-epoxy-1,2-dihydrophenyl)acetyl-CoA isomerase